MGTFGGAGGAASGAMQLGFQELNRAAAFGAQAGGIAVSGLLESVVPPTGGSSDWSTTIPGKLLSGIAGVRPTQNTAGQTQPPLPANQTGGGGGNTQGAGSGGGVTNIHGPITVQANNPQQLFDGLTAHQDQQSADVRQHCRPEHAYHRRARVSTWPSGIIFRLVGISL